ncbi:hypothetical protein EGW08_008632 [Elysia chlorotica]|uniref:Uncharacterized protein n=1 Tax=Elysia chlorotica TaxID=188477 RepID=A0A433TPT3_ELYCH|nr:hypothetical protein EGW08_008632 [Elysia chlorotica]
MFSQILNSRYVPGTSVKDNDSSIPRSSKEVSVSWADSHSGSAMGDSSGTLSLLITGSESGYPVATSPRNINEYLSETDISVTDFEIDEEEYLSFREELKRIIMETERDNALLNDSSSYEKLTPEELDGIQQILRSLIYNVRKNGEWIWKKTVDGIIEPIRQRVAFAFMSADPEQTMADMDITEEEYLAFKAELKDIVEDIEKDLSELSEGQVAELKARAKKRLKRSKEFMLQLIDFIRKDGICDTTRPGSSTTSIRDILMSAFQDEPCSDNLTCEELELLRRRRQFLLRLNNFLKRHGRWIWNRPAEKEMVLKCEEKATMAPVMSRSQYSISADEDLRANQNLSDPCRRYFQPCSPSRDTMSLPLPRLRTPCKRPICERLARERLNDPCSRPKTKRGRCKVSTSQVLGACAGNRVCSNYAA